jgi:hypothetical protein
MFYQMSFTFDFSEESGDNIYFAYSFPYTLSRLFKLLKHLKADTNISTFYKESILCSSLSGIDVPLLTITQISKD